MAESNGTPTKRAAHRSPNHPAFSLANALEKIKLVYDKDRRTPTTSAVIVGHLGYKHTDGPGGRALSCLRQYGLLEETAGNWKVSDAAFNILHLPDSDPEKAKLVREAALKPALYRMLRDDYPGGIPSDETLTSNLLRRGFNPLSIDFIIEDFRSTMQFAKVYDGLHTDGEEKSKMLNELLEPITSKTDKPQPFIIDQSSGKTYALDFEGTGKAVLTLTGEYTKEDLDDLKSYIDTSLKILHRSLAKKENLQ